MRDDFDRDSSKPNPYEEADNRTFLSFVNHFVSDSTTDLTMAQLRLELLKEEAKQTSSNLPKVPASTFFRKALDIEDRL